MLHRLIALASVAVLTTTGAVCAQDIKLPPTMAVTAYDTGTAGFNIAVAVGKMMKDKYSTDVRVLPAGNDVARLAPLRAGRAVASAMGSGSYFAQEGVFEFGAKEWGPQSLQVLLGTTDCNGGSVGVAKDTGITQIKELRGKRLGFVVGSPALNQNALAIIAFAGLTQKDVKVVEFASYGAMWKGIINNDADAGFATTITGPARELENSPRGIIWPPLPHADKEGWARVQKVGAFFTPMMATCGAGITADKPIEMGTYPYPIFVTYGSQSPDVIYPIVKAMIVNYDDYKDGAPGAGGLAAKRQTMKWVVPFHPGAVKAMKEAGNWTDDDQKHNDGLFRRQDVLKAAWTDYSKANASLGEKEYLEGWMKARATALAKANMPNGFE
ncbi:TAXI family TRAP transporter solute-binding subunit [Tardiphaga sp. P9-11]|uniref:TAXI family TRAP transporter solute-binding subunit n=1 Tax=Tardiphaga sp. P9-11 TaxID=2024614 RepID=UPI0011F2339F|nr:TAXI family TRAP transporter solute-binding subunit [Tardiphaga sp. P9-11]KAA0077022.1 TAXI family TRAP transporter solute-binding subunit [Tardiphaga sp. P9-11]